MQYGSIGWSVGATLGYQVAAKDKRCIACIGDGSFQMTVQVHTGRELAGSHSANAPLERDPCQALPGFYR
jgi:TPP-dependent trihydroxycyclohexane-1,2-dione (THcHDO) dehydratase